MKKVLNFQPATTTIFGTFRILISYCLKNTFLSKKSISYDSPSGKRLVFCSIVLIFFMSNNLSAQSNQDRNNSPDIHFESELSSIPIHTDDQTRMTYNPTIGVIEIVTVDGVQLMKVNANPIEEPIVNWELTPRKP